MDKVDFNEMRNGIMNYYREGKYGDALELVEQNADRFPEQIAPVTFWRLCFLSLCGRPDDLFALLQQALDSGLWYTGDSFLDPDFNAVRELPEFQRLVALSHQKSLDQIKPERSLLVPDDTTKALPLIIALHGNTGNKDSHLEHWEIARQRGWLVLSPQSTQAYHIGSYSWNDPLQGMKDISSHIDEIKQMYKIDPERVIIAGFSQGAGMALYMLLKGNLAARGFIGISPWWADVNDLACENKTIRGYFVLGEKDHVLERAREIEATLKNHHVPFADEIHANSAHEFPPDFASSFDRAIHFILE